MITPQPTQHIRVFASTQSLTISEDKPASFHVAVEVDEPYRIIAALPGESEFARSVFPLRAGLTQGGGLAVYADYPQGEPFIATLDESHFDQTPDSTTNQNNDESVSDSGAPSLANTPQLINTHTGRIEFEIAVEKAPGIGIDSGAPKLGISFQLITETTIQHPQSVQLGIDINIEDS